MIVYHGTSVKYQDRILCPAIHYALERGKNLKQAFSVAHELLDTLLDVENRFQLQRALDDAQTTGVKNPFVSTSADRKVARQFATATGNGFIYTIEGPESELFNFNKVRDNNGFPRHETFFWMKELGIKFEISNPFEIIKIEQIVGIREISQTIYEKIEP